jgi:L-cystine uptake protein TcyP (sodium:dicarboxylate symporter family)
MNKLEIKPKPMHRSWVRLLPYTAFGALLISFQSASSFESIATIYGLLMAVQLSAVIIYLIAAKKLDRHKENNP